MRPEGNPSTIGDTKGTKEASFAGNPTAPFLNMRSKGGGNQQRGVPGVFPSVGSGLVGSQHRASGFSRSMGYSRHGSLGRGGGDMIGGRVVLKGDNTLGEQ